MVPEHTEEQLMEMRMRAEANRRAQWKGAIQQELQVLVAEASDIRNKIDTAKTKFKKEFYLKKFKKTSAKVMQMIAALQRIEGGAQMPQGPTPHVHDENCQHDHEEQENETPAANQA